jgi:hypothetical protein
MQSCRYIIAAYDLININDYIFSGNSVQEISGAAEIVRNIHEIFPKSAVRKVCSGMFRFKTQWYNPENDRIEAFEITKNRELAVEVIYTGGGITMIAFQSVYNIPAEQIYLKVNRELSRIVLQNTGGMLKFTTEYIETDFSDFNRDRNMLVGRLKKKTFEMLQTFPFSGITGTDYSVYDSEPASGRPAEKTPFQSGIKKEYSRKTQFFELIPEEMRSKYHFADDYANLGADDTNNRVAMVHIDGNDMGKLYRKILGNASVYENGIRTGREFSLRIQKIYREIMKRAVHNLVYRLEEDGEFFSKIPVLKDDRTAIPLCPVVLGGDDVTFLCASKIALSFSELFLREISDVNFETVSGAQPLSACAGIAFIKPGFPFSQAYQLSEALCNSAKSKAKIIARKENIDTGCWIDFEIINSGMTSDLNLYREINYNLTGTRPPEPVKTESQSYRQYNLLSRPWFVAGYLPEEFDRFHWKHFRNVYARLKNIYASVNKTDCHMKKLRFNEIGSVQDMEQYIKKIADAGMTITDSDPEYQDGLFLNRYRQTKYFDPINMIDCFVEID